MALRSRRPFQASSNSEFRAMKKLVIGCGYLGTRVANAWLANGDDVLALTRSTANATALRELGIQPIVGDVMDADSLKALPQADSLLYAVGYDRTSGRSQREIYVEGLKNVISEVGSRIRQVIYISSTSVYGQSSGEWIDEHSESVPSQPGGQACLEAERRLWDLASSQSASPKVCVLRLAGIYGPGRLLRRIDALKSREPLRGNSEAWLNLIHVDDAAQAVRACETFGQLGETYLVCDDRPIRRREYFERLAALVGAPPPIFESTSESNTSSAELNKRCSNRKMRDALQVRLIYPDINTGLPHAVQNTG